MSVHLWAGLERDGERLYAHGDDAAAAERFRHAARVARVDHCGQARLAASLFSLTILYQHQGRYRPAERASRGALRAEELALGANHPYVADILRRRAEILRKLARADEARQADARARAIMGRPAMGGAPRAGGQP